MITASLHQVPQSLDMPVLAYPLLLAHAPSSACVLRACLSLVIPSRLALHQSGECCRPFMRCIGDVMTAALLPRDRTWLPLRLCCTATGTVSFPIPGSLFDFLSQG
eukprot:765094-Hanusia_phi.AAC.1